MVKALTKNKKPHKKPESYEHVIKRFTAGEVKYLSAYFEVHVLKNRRDTEKIPPIVIKHETDPVSAVNGYKTDGSVLPHYFARYRKAQEAYKELLKEAYAESKRLFAMYKGKRAIAVIEKTLPLIKK